MARRCDIIPFDQPQRKGERDIKGRVGGIEKQAAGAPHKGPKSGPADPVVLGHGRPLFAGPRPRLRLAANDVIDGDVIRLTYVPAG